MNTEDVRFAVAWTLAPSLEVVSAVLGLAPEHVIRRAEMMRAVGVPLEELGHTLEGRAHTNDSPVAPTAKSGPSLGKSADLSYIAQLRTAAQVCFYAKYAVDRDGASSIAEPESLAGEMSSSIRHRFRPAVSTKSRAQLDAVWYASSAAGAARCLGKSVRTVTSFVGRLRRMGVPMRHLPAHPGPLVRAVRGLAPSVN